jgi:hypothetical protein
MLRFDGIPCRWHLETLDSWIDVNSCRVDSNSWLFKFMHNMDAETGKYWKDMLMPRDFLMRPFIKKIVLSEWL